MCDIDKNVKRMLNSIYLKIRLMLVAKQRTMEFSRFLWVFLLDSVCQIAKVILVEKNLTCLC